ncbi:MAG: hypothetical protein ABL883_06495 [Terricaulis sp.]
MRQLVFATLALLCACAPIAGRCDMQATRVIDFSAADESVNTRSIGAACNKAIGVFAVLDAEDRPIWSWSAPLESAYGDIFPSQDREAMRDFIERWAQPSVAETSTAPEWTLLAPGQSTLDRATYEDLRARNLPMLCHSSGSARETCIFWEPAAGFAGHFYDRDVALKQEE